MSTPEQVDTKRWYDEIIRKSKGDVAFFVIAGFIHLTSWAIPDIKTGDETVSSLYKRGDYYDSDWISFSNLVTYTAMNALGFIYICIITHNRRTGFYSTNMNRFDFFAATVILGPFVFMTSAIVTWRSRHSIDNLICSEDEMESCQSYSNMDCFKYNFFWWTSWYFIGLQFTYIQSVVPDISLEWD